jgi:DNA-damage-inducible protein D
MLAETARDAGVITNEEFAVFQNSGYMGLYGGMTVEAIHNKNGLAVREKILDYMYVRVAVFAEISGIV